MMHSIRFGVFIIFVFAVNQEKLASLSPENYVLTELLSKKFMLNRNNL